MTYTMPYLFNTFGTLLTYFGSNPERFCEVFELLVSVKIYPVPEKAHPGK